MLKTSLKLLLGIAHMLQTPIAVIFTLYIIFLFSSQFLASMLKPICSIPGASLVPICSLQAQPQPSQGPQDRPPKWADYPRLVDMQATTLGQLLDQTAGGSGLALEIKKAELATHDLTTLVRVSDLTSRELLADTLVGFVGDAKKTAEDLQRLGAKVGGAVDRHVSSLSQASRDANIVCSVMAMNDYALNKIDAAQNGQPSAVMRVLWPFGSASGTQEVVRSTFEDAMAVMGDAMARVVVEAQLSLGHLQDLEQRLLTLHEIIAREDKAVEADKGELLAHLWTKLGGNKKKMKGFERHVQLLGGVRAYRKQALGHVVGTLQTLSGMQADMEELRARVASVPVGGERIPVEVHMRSIQKGLERMKEGRVRAKQLEEEAVKKVLGE